MASNFTSMSRKARWLRIAICLVLLLLAAQFCYWQNNSIVVSRYQYASEKIGGQLDGFTILQISDLHNKDFQGRLISQAAALSPDIIAITGDLIDCRHPEIEIALELVRYAAAIAPVYYVSGNHESNLNQYDQLRQELIAAGAMVLDDAALTVERDGDSFNLIGLADPLFGGDLFAILPAQRQEGMLNLLLAHRPELIADYAAAGMDLVLSGHAHGGQVRLPLLGGLFAPGQGLLPDYSAGLYQVDSSTLLVSRGLGNSVAPQRIFNRPELVVLTLHSAA